MSTSASPDSRSHSLVEQESIPLPDVKLTPTLLYQILVAEIAGQRRHFNVAAEGYLRVAKETLDPRIIKRAARISAFAGLTDKAAEASKLWLSLDANAIEPLSILAAAALKQQELDTALKHLEKITTTLKGDPKQAYTHISAVLARHQNKQESLQLINSLIKTEPNNVYALFTRAQLAMHNSKLELADQSIQQVLEIRPKWGSAIVLRARILHMQNKSPLAIQFLEKKLDRGGLDGEYDVRITYARMLVDERRAMDAYKQFELLDAERANSADVIYALGLLSIQLKQVEQATEHFTKLLSLDKHQAEAAYFLGQFAEEENEPEAAIRWYESVKRGEYYFTAQLRIIKLLQQQQATEQAILYLKSITPRNRAEKIQLQITEGNLLQELERHSEAMEIFNQALQEEPDESSLLYARALVAEKLDRIDLLEKDLRQILEREPDNAHALNALGFTLADRTERYEEALSLLEKALALTPKEAAVLDSMGWVHFRLKSYKKAIHYLKQALELQNDPEIAAHLGEVLWVEGNKELAKEVWDKASQQFPNHPFLNKTIKRLSK